VPYCYRNSTSTAFLADKLPANTSAFLCFSELLGVSKGVGSFFSVPVVVQTDEFLRLFEIAYEKVTFRRTDRTGHKEFFL
jgi:hypothetical protein